jgi:hypothetical protein
MPFMSAANAYNLPSPQIVSEQISAVEDELKALRRLLRASKAAEKAEAARSRRHGVIGQQEARGARCAG